jgi:amino acid adenylation domain-containing protein
MFSTRQARRVGVPPHGTRPVLDRFQERAATDPDHPALTQDADVVSYAELNGRANRLARWLADRGVAEGQLVAIHLARGIPQVTAVLAVLKTGAAFVPIDPANPAERVAQMLAGVELVLCGVEHTGALRGTGVEAVPVDVLDLSGSADTNLDREIGPEQVAYVIYTSGSTGTPKGVVVSHAALANLADWISATFRIGPADRTGIVCSPGFDAAMCELWPSLVAGAAIDVPDGEVLLSPAATVSWLIRAGITVGILPTPLAEPVLREPWPDEVALRALLTGGDQLHFRPPEGLPFQLVNNYGPTENTGVSTSGPVGAHGTELPSIGKAVPGTVAEILDEDLRPVADGDVGEIYLGGAQLARGYLGRSDLTADRFVPHPFPATPGERLYRTGDLGRRGPDGDIEFLGRIDDQVKVRGSRIEPAEVTAALAGHPQVVAAHTLAHRDDGGATHLVGYVVPADPRRLPAASSLREHLRQRLPAAMVPSAFVILDALPRGTNGKVDRAALPPPDLRRSGASGPYVAPTTDTERAIAEIWREVLSLERVGVRDGFFDLGGHSLVATQIIARVRESLGVDVPIREVFRSATLGEFAATVDARRAGSPETPLPPIQPGTGAATSPLSVPQQQVWFIQGLAPGNIAYHAQATIRVIGALDLDVFARALTELTRRHESLRTTYEEGADGPVQVLHPPAPFPLTTIDLSDLPAAARDARLEEVVRAELATPFDLGQLPLTRWTAIRLAPEEYELVLVEHHLVHDGWSVSVLMRELEALYNAFVAGEPSPLPEPPVQYRDYVRWQRDLLDSDLLRRQVEYWRERLTGAAQLALPTDRPRPATQRFRGELLRPAVPAGLPGRLRELCRREGVSLYMTMYAAFAALLHRYTGGRDICVASGFANRRVREAEGLIGMLVNPVVLRLDVSGAAPFRDLLAQARDVVLDAAAHQECPFPLVVNALGLERDPSRNPLTQVMFSCHDSAVRNPEFAGAASTIFERGNGTAKMDLNIIVVPRAKSHLGHREHTDDRITVLWEYNTDLFDAQTMRTMSQAYVRLLDAAVADPDTPVGALALLDDRQTHEILVDWNAPRRRAVPRHTAPVHRQVEQWARRMPSALAVADDRESVTYGALDERAEKIAAALGGSVGEAERVVGVCLPRGASLVAAELGVLKAGAAFLPIDPGNPDERIRQIFTIAGAGAVVTSAELRERLAVPLPTVLVDDPTHPVIAPVGRGRSRDGRPTGPDDLAYIIFTSGSTGEPKGVLALHHGFANLVAWHREAFGLGPGTRSTAVASPGFDFSIWEVWPALTSGGSVHMPSNSVLLSAPELQRWLLAERIEVALLPTPVAESLFAIEWPDAGALRHLHAAGDRLTVRPRGELGFAVHNSYGPTENTAISTSGTVVPGGPELNLPDIGTPIDGTSAYVLDAELNPVPPGAIGEIYVGGTGIARGYAGRPDLTADRFVPDPFAGQPGARLYRTGDLARQTPGGSIEFLGRSDHQVQIRGHRIEPGEVTAALRGHEELRDAFTAAYTDPNTGRTCLVGYLVPRTAAAAPDVEHIRAHLGRTLPTYMLPTAYVVLDELPLTRNGKVDRRALPAPELSRPAGRRTTPASGGERRLAEIWARVLELDQVGVDESFFDLGGHSLLLADVHRRVQQEFGRQVPLVSLFEHPTVRAFARYLDAEAGDALAGGQELGERRRAGRANLARQRGARAGRTESS